MSSRREFATQLFGGVAAGALLGQTPIQAAPVPSGADRAPEDEAFWRWIAEQFLTSDIAYMNTGTRGPSPASVVQAQLEAIRAYDSDRLSYAKYVDNAAFRAGLRSRLANLVGCGSHEIALTNNTTEGMAFGTMGIDLERGDEIVYTNHDHSSGAQPINLRGARHAIKPVVVDLSDARFHPPKSADQIVAAFDAAMTPRTRLLSFCHINYTDGCVLPVADICALARSKGVLTLVDGAHPPGMMDLNIAELGCDMYAGACHKWMLAGMLTGFFFVREGVQDRVWPTVYSGPVDGMNMYHAPQPPGSSLELAATAARYEMHGSNSYANAASLDAAVDFHARLTPAAIEARDRYLAARARDGLRDIRGVRVHVSEDPAAACAIVSFDVRGVDPIELNELLWSRHHIYIRNVTHDEINWNVNRASLHIMNTTAQVDELVGAVAEVARERRA